MIYELCKDDVKPLESETAMDEIKTLWTDCFHDTESYSQFYFTWKTKENTIYVIREDDKIVSMIHLNPYHLKLRKKTYPSYYVVGVATEESYRRRGLMRRLLIKSMEEMRQKKIPFTYLMPASEAIYSPYDFRVITVQKRYVTSIYELMNTSLIKDKEESTLQKKEVESEAMLTAASVETSEFQTIVLDKDYLEDGVLQEELKELVNFANEILSLQEEIYTIRDEYYYERMIAEMKTGAGEVIVIKCNDVLIGYGAYSIEQGNVYVLESLFDYDKEALVLQGVLNRVKERIESLNLVYDRVTETEEAPCIMARIIHVEEFLKQLRAKQPITLQVHISDEYLHENTGDYLLSIDQLSCTVTKLLKETRDFIPEVSMSIAELTEFCLHQPMDGKLSCCSTEHYSVVDEKMNYIQSFTKIHINEIV